MRAGQDIDLACLGKTRRQIADHLERAGAAGSPVQQRQRDRQMYFTAPSDALSTSWWTGCRCAHAGFPVLVRLHLVGYAAQTLDPADLLLSKLQIVELNAKDAHDIFHLLSGLRVGRDAVRPAIDPDRFGAVLARTGLVADRDRHLAKLGDLLSSSRTWPPYRGSTS